jgi:hypothetical protein
MCDLFYGVKPLGSVANHSNHIVSRLNVREATSNFPICLNEYLLKHKDNFAFTVFFHNPKRHGKVRNPLQPRWPSAGRQLSETNSLIALHSNALRNEQSPGFAVYSYIICLNIRKLYTLPMEQGVSHKFLITSSYFPKRC